MFANISKGKDIVVSNKSETALNNLNIVINNVSLQIGSEISNDFEFFVGFQAKFSLSQRKLTKNYVSFSRICKKIFAV